MEFDFIWVDGREGDERIIWMIQEGRFCNICSISSLSGLPSATYGLNLFYFILFISYTFCLEYPTPPLLKRLAVNANITHENSGTISCGFCPHIDKWQTPLLSFFAHGRYEKKSFSFNNERRIIWYLENCIWAIAKRCNFTPHTKCSN